MYPRDNQAGGSGPPVVSTTGDREILVEEGPSGTAIGSHGGEGEMRDVHEIFTTFKNEFPEIAACHEQMGKEIHVNGGPLDEKTRALLKVAISGASGHLRALETHSLAARQAGASEQEITHTLLLLIPTCGFPTFMEAYKTLQEFDGSGA
jgi:4-carboxymuconolactone decarboxylase